MEQPTRDQSCEPTLSTLESPVPHQVQDEFTYAQWHLISSGPDGLRYLATRKPDNLVVEIKVVQPLAKDKEVVIRLRHRAKLVGLCSTALVRQVIEIRLEDDLPLMVIERPCVSESGDLFLSEAIALSVSFDRLRIARELVAALRIAHRLGLAHGHLDGDCLVLGNDSHLRIDFMTVNVARPKSLNPDVEDYPPWTFRDVIDCGIPGDLVSLQRLLRRLLDDKQVDLSSLPARARAGLRSMLRDDQRPEAEVPTLLQWETSLGTGRVAPVINDPNATIHTPAPPSVGRPANPDRSLNLSLEETGELTPGQLPGDESSLYGVPTSVRPQLKPGDVIGRYRLELLLGQGGMGIVYRGVDIADGSRVAIKIIRSFDVDSPQAVRRFQKEARLLSGVQNDYVTKLYEVGEDEGMHFIAMEYVEGVTLKDWLAQSGPLPEKLALSVVADIAKGLMDAHAKGIVHRDIKPENVLLQNSVTGESDLSSKRIKLSDFGIARQIDQSASMEVTQAGVMLGTPRYMSPEQCRGSKAIGPAADVYSLGITLYQMLAGVPPFDADEAIKLVSMHCFDPVPSIQKKVSTVSDLTANLLNRTLAKEPQDRFADAGQMLAGIQRILLGDVADFELHPKMPVHDPARLWQKTFTWDLESSPSQLWPYVSNTERLNRAIGLPSVEYRTENDPKRGLRKFGSFKLGGVNVAWEEHPFEWTQGSRMGILREFTSGPFKWFMSIVALNERPEGGTRLEHQVRIESRNLLGRVMTTIEADWRGGKNLDRVYRRVDRAIQKKLQPDQGADAFEAATKPPKQQQDRLEQRSERLIDRGVDPELVTKLTEFLAAAPPQVLSQIRPIALAHQLEVDEDQCLQACLIAASEALLVLRWDILCPTCRVSASAETLLSSIKDHTHCAACDYDFRSDLGDAIELVFRVHPEIRDADDAVYCIGGPEHSPHVVAQIRLEASERVELELHLVDGDYLIRGPRLIGQQRIRVRVASAPSTFEIAVTELGSSEHTPVLRAGIQTVTLTNDRDHLQVLRVERMIPRDDVVTATRASTLPLFRELFPDQVLGQDRPIEADEMTLVATSIFDVERLYQRLGDRQAYDVIGRHLEVIRRCVVSHRGTVAKTIGEGVLAAFVNCDFAIDAALSMQSAINEEEELQSIRLNIAVHRGRTLVATMNQRLDYFGATSRTVSSLPDFAEGDLLLTEAVYGDPVVQHRLQERGCSMTIETVRIPGRQAITVQRVVQRKS